MFFSGGLVVVTTILVVRFSKIFFCGILSMLVYDLVLHYFMTDNSLRHTIAMLTTLVSLMAWISGYVSGAYGLWWTALGLVVVYICVYKIINKD